MDAVDLGVRTTRVRYLKHALESVSSVIAIGEPEDPELDGLEVLVIVRDGRRFKLAARTVAFLQRSLAVDPSVLVPGLMVVRDLSDASILDGVRVGVGMGLEKFAIQETGKNS